MAGRDAPVLSAAVYARISADTDGKSLGVQRQLEDCRKLAADRGWPVGAEYVDNDMSAFSGSPGQAMSRWWPISRPGVRDAVIVYNLDRLHRRPAELEEFVGLCERVGVSQVATVTADIDLGNDDGLFMARIFAAFAAKESGRKSARMRRKLMQNAEQGLPHGSVRAFGYEHDKITLREREAAVVREIVERVLAGAIGAVADGLAQRFRGAPAGGDAGPPPRCGESVLGAHRRAARAPGQMIGTAVWDRDHHRGRARAGVGGVGVAFRDPHPRAAHLCALGDVALRALRGPAVLPSPPPSGRTVPPLCVPESGPDHGGCGRITVVAEPVEELLVDAVLARLDSPPLADALAGKSRGDRDVTALGRRWPPISAAGGTGRAVCRRRHHRAGMDHRPRPDHRPHHRHRTGTRCGHRHHRGRRAGRAPVVRCASTGTASPSIASTPSSTPCSITPSSRRAPLVRTPSTSTASNPAGAL